MKGERGHEVSRSIKSTSRCCDLGIKFYRYKIWCGTYSTISSRGNEIYLCLFSRYPIYKKPKVSWKFLFAYAFTVGIGQFSSLFYAIKIGMPAGVSSVVVQSQAFFTILIERVLYRDRLRNNQVVGLVISAIGLILVGGNIGGSSNVSIPLPALLLTLLAALFWAMSNIVASMIAKDGKQRGEKVDMFPVVVWSSLIPPIPMILVALILNGPEVCLMALKNINLVGITSMVYLGWGATLAGYGIWSSLMAKYPPKNVAPLSLLVPIVGLIGSQIVLGESLSVIQWVGCGVIILGLIIFNLRTKRLRSAS